MKVCPKCGDGMTLARVLEGPIFKNGRVEVWVHALTGSALCVNELELDPDTGILIDARKL